LENKGLTFPNDVRGLANSLAIRERRPNEEFISLWFDYGVKGSKVALGFSKKGNKAAGVQYQINMYMTVRPDGRCDLCCRWGHIENKCGSKSICGWC